MRNFITAIAIALLAVVAPVKAMAKGKRQQQDAPKAEDQAKKKAAEEAYKNALKNIPGSNEKLDPWKSMRWPPLWAKSVAIFLNRRHLCVPKT
ncbi:MAG: hypothetical protein WBA14_08310 [Pseudolabrys sp.]